MSVDLTGTKTDATSTAELMDALKSHRFSTDFSQLQQKVKAKLQRAKNEPTQRNAVASSLNTS